MINGRLRCRFVLVLMLEDPYRKMMYAITVERLLVNNKRRYATARILCLVLVYAQA
jgi:hypothetical protein